MSAATIASAGLEDEMNAGTDPGIARDMTVEGHPATDPALDIASPRETAHETDIDPLVAIVREKDVAPHLKTETAQETDVAPHLAIENVPEAATQSASHHENARDLARGHETAKVSLTAAKKTPTRKRIATAIAAVAPPPPNLSPPAVSHANLRHRLLNYQRASTVKAKHQPHRLNLLCSIPTLSSASPAAHPKPRSKRRTRN
jgi:hypothetical protein